MRSQEPKTRYHISKSQIELMLYFLKCRFINSDLLAELLKKDRSTIYERLSVLVSQGYIAKQYDKTFRLKGRSATYCLAPAGIRYLKHHGYERTQLHYKNKNFTDEQIDTQLLYVKIWLILRKQYPDKFYGYTKYQLDSKDYIKPAPHLKLEGKTDKIPDYLVEVFPAFTMSWRIRKRINMHCDAANDSEYTYPHLLLIAGNISTEKRIIKMTADLYAGFDIFTTSLDRLMSGEKKIWLKPEEVDWYEKIQTYHSLCLKVE
jgi:predicted transcriptional regulator